MNVFSKWIAVVSQTLKGWLSETYGSDDPIDENRGLKPATNPPRMPPVCRAGVGDGAMGFVVPMGDGSEKVVVFYGGPYRRKPEDLRGIKMAAEIDLPSFLHLDVVDFQTPTHEEMRLLLAQTWIAIVSDPAERQQYYVGCMGGIGRTGLFLAAWTKLWMHQKAGEVMPGHGPIARVREEYKKHAVETIAQEEFIRDLQVHDIVPCT